MLLIGGGTDLGRAFAGVLDGQGRDDDGDLSPASRLGAGDDHARQARIDREQGQLPARRGDRDRSRLIAGQSAQLGEHGAPVTDGLGLRRGEEREIEDLFVAGRESEVGHLQDDAGQVRAQDLRVGEFGA